MVCRLLSLSLLLLSLMVIFIVAGLLIEHLVPEAVLIAVICDASNLGVSADSAVGPKSFRIKALAKLN